MPSSGADLLRCGLVARRGDLRRRQLRLGLLDRCARHLELLEVRLLVPCVLRHERRVLGLERGHVARGALDESLALARARLGHPLHRRAVALLEASAEVEHRRAVRAVQLAQRGVVRTPQLVERRVGRGMMPPALLVRLVRRGALEGAPQLGLISA